MLLGSVSADAWPHLPPPRPPQLLCASVQRALLEEEDHVKRLQREVAALEQRNRQLRERLKKAQRSARRARKTGRRLELANRKLGEKLAAHLRG